MGRIDFSITSRFIAGARVLEPVSTNLIIEAVGETYRDCEAGGHSVEVIRVLTHCHDFGNDGLACPFHPKDLC